MERLSLPSFACFAYSAVKLGNGSSITARGYWPRGVVTTENAENAETDQGLNRGIRQIRRKEMERLSLSAFACFACSAVKLGNGTSITARDYWPRGVLTTENGRVERKARNERHKGQRPPLPSPSSNRTCRFPASGSRQGRLCQKAFTTLSSPCVSSEHGH